MDRLTKAELVNGFPVCYPNNCSGLPEFVTKGNPYRNIVERLKAYEDLEEQGKLLKLPCSVGDTVYTACSWGIESGIVGSIEIISDRIFVNNTRGQMIGEARNIFLTREEAEATLKELRDKKG